MLLFAAKIAEPHSKKDMRNFWLGCVGIRKDGALVFSQNGAVFSTTISNYQFLPECHAECRTLRKMDRGGILYVSRILRKDQSLAMAMPCGMCQVKIKSKDIRKVYYSINESQFGVWYVREDIHRIYDDR